MSSDRHKTQQKRAARKALNPQNDRELLRDLELSATLHRKQLLRLGGNLGIRLHYGACTSMVEIITLLYLYWMRLRSGDPNWPDRDRFVLSKGHGAPSLYIALAMRGFIDESHFRTFRQVGSILQGHPDRNKTPGVDCSTGSLGQGMPVACGIALGAMIGGDQYNIYALISDGECNEGSIWEAALIASNQRLANLTVLLDRNGKSSYGEMRGRNDVEPLKDKWEAFGWYVAVADGHDYVSLSTALAEVESQPHPGLVLCNTVKGKGIPYAENNRTPSNFELTGVAWRDAMDALEAKERELSS
jgi:transketolase